MDPATAAGFAASILTFIDFSWKLVKGSYEIYHRPTGASKSDAQLSTVLEDLDDLARGLKAEVKESPHREPLEKLAEECTNVGEELSSILDGLKRKEGNKVWRSLEAKWKSMRKEQEVACLEDRLGSLRMQLLLRLVSLIGDEQSSLTSQVKDVKEKGLLLSPGTLERLEDAHRSSHQVWKDLKEQVSSHRLENSAAALDTQAALATLITKLSELPRNVALEDSVLKRLWFPAMYAREDNIADAEDGTFGWILKENRVGEPEGASEEELKEESEEAEQLDQVRKSFISWLQSDDDDCGQVYHISGKAGSGKSTLMRFLCNHDRLKYHLRAWAGDTELIFASFFFWSSGDKEERTLEGLYRRLLYEILKQCPQLIQTAFPSQCAQLDQPFRVAELKAATNALLEAADLLDHRFCFFIDGLDEFETDQNTDHQDLAMVLRKWASSPNVKICVSSRPYVEFQQTFRLRMCLHDLTKGDVRRFVQSNMKKEPNYRKLEDGHLDPDIVEDIVERAEGVFLWVRLVTRSIVDGIRHRLSPEMLRKRLDKLPRGLEALFDQLFDDIDPTDKETANKMLLLAVHYNPVNHVPNALIYSWIEELSNPEFPFSSPIASYSDEEITTRHETVRCQLRSLTRGLLEMRPNQGSHGDLYFKFRVDFFHRTVRDYLSEPHRQLAMERQVDSRFAIGNASRRLRFAEFKFLRTRQRYFKRGPDLSPMIRCFTSAFSGDGYDGSSSSSALVDDYEAVLSHHLKTPFSYPGESEPNPCSIHWTLWTGIRGTPSYNPPLDFSYIYFLAYWGRVEDVLRRVRETPSPISNRNQMTSLLSSAAVGCNFRLVGQILHLGASPGEPLVVIREGHNEDTIPMWIAFLVRMIEYMLISWENDMYAWTSRRIDLFRTLEVLLKAGAGSKHLYFILGLGSYVGGKDVSASEPMGISLEDLVLYISPPNSAQVLELIHREKYGSWLSRGMKWAAETLVPSDTKDFEFEFNGRPVRRLHTLDNEGKDLKVLAVFLDGQTFKARFRIRLW
ncbi:hypothetical protein MKZ38_003773 [Zalerion maritima]|uniref:NACHT domain-containing protein n=1 Tax=Zalerion maritima TaxID=339359 RepID=A0AAD5RNP8_9PEZI|nr:hypothetical protein MKZ38_003773 [Zalerion maritima]